jgi:hypothetical protein
MFGCIAQSLLYDLQVLFCPCRFQFYVAALWKIRGIVFVERFSMATNQQGGTPTHNPLRSDWGFVFSRPNAADQIYLSVMQMPS